MISELSSCQLTLVKIYKQHNNVSANLENQDWGPNLNESKKLQL